MKKPLRLVKKDNVIRFPLLRAEEETLGTSELFRAIREDSQRNVTLLLSLEGISKDVTITASPSTETIEGRCPYEACPMEWKFSFYDNTTLRIARRIALHFHNSCYDALQSS